jgi:hypothetical protein
MAPNFFSRWALRALIFFLQKIGLIINL